MATLFVIAGLALLAFVVSILLASFPGEEDDEDSERDFAKRAWEKETGSF